MSFNPLLRNSLWFEKSRGWVSHRAGEVFQPSLEEFFMIHCCDTWDWPWGCWGFNPLLRNSLWFHIPTLSDLGDKPCCVSTLSWGILYDSMRSIRGISLPISLFQPSLEEFFMIPPSIRNNRHNILLKFQPSLEEFFMIQHYAIFDAFWGINIVSTLSWGILYDSRKK